MAGPRSAANVSWVGTVVVTGVAGFIGAAVAERLLASGWSVVGIDDLNEYYDASLKEARLRRLLSMPGFDFERLSLEKAQPVQDRVIQARPQVVIHLAAQAGVRHSIDHPEPYVYSNLVGFASILEAARRASTPHLIYASSSSVYGSTTPTPFRETCAPDHPESLYAATKRSNELMAYSYSRLHGLTCTGLRFFTVYGSWGRPDMAYFKFATLIRRGQTIPVFNRGDVARDFTHVTDVVDAIERLVRRPPSTDIHEPDSTAALLNVGRGSPTGVLDLVRRLEDALGRKAHLELLPAQPGDVPITWADTSRLRSQTGLAPQVSVDEGIREFADWFMNWAAKN